MVCPLAHFLYPVGILVFPFKSQELPSKADNEAAATFQEARTLTNSSNYMHLEYVVEGH